jgi:hypothetical protein
MRMPRVVLSVAACIALAAPALAQMPAYPPPPGGPMSCYCLQASVDAVGADYNAKQADLAAAQGQLSQLDQQLAAARAHEDVNNPQSVAEFRQLLAQRDAAFQRSTGDVATAAQATSTRYNQAVADYNNQCAGRPLPPPPAGPLVCPGR